MTEFRTVGKSLVRKDARSKVMGLAEYTGDVKLPGMLYGAILYSSYAFARILSIDTSEAEAMPGVEVVVTGKDYPKLYGGRVTDRPYFAFDLVRFTGEPVAAVAAETKEIAHEALKKIKVEYEPLQPIFDVEESFREHENLIHPDLDKYKKSGCTPLPSSNVCAQYHLKKGDVEKGFAEADRIIEGTYHTPAVQHGFIEPHITIAQFHRGENRLLVWDSTVAPFNARKEISNMFGIPMSRIRVTVPSVGGSFGAKMYIKTEIYATALALKTDRPVKMEMSRAEEFAMSVRGPSLTKIKTGVMNDGTIVARQVETLWDTGAYADCGPTIMTLSGHASPGPYYIPNEKVDSYTVYTNKGISVAYRGYGCQETSFAYECHTDDIARELGMDPIEFRMKNVLKHGMEGSTGQLVDSGGLDLCLENVKNALDWDNYEKKPWHGRGISITHKGSGAGAYDECYIKLNEDCVSYDLIMGVIEQGQGSNTVMAQICAEAMDIDYDQIYVCPPNTDYTPFEAGTTGSRATYCTGNAIIEAAKDLRKKIKEMAAGYFSCEAEEIELDLRAGKAFVRGCRDVDGRSADLAAIMRAMHEGRGGSLTGDGIYRGTGIPGDANGQTPYMTPFWMYCAQGCEVEIDPETGAVHILKEAGCSDVGQIMNRSNAIGQVSGGMIQGTSGGLLEDVITDSRGYIVNANLYDYKMMTTMDIPDEIRVDLTETPQPDGPFGAKGMGEGPVAPGSACIANAICDALGIQIHEAPVITPEIVLSIIRKKQNF